MRDHHLCCLLENIEIEECGWGKLLGHVLFFFDWKYATR